VRERFLPLNAGWKAGRNPVESFFGPAMDLSTTASRFDNSISWIAAIGNEAALATFDDLGVDAVFARNRALSEHLHSALREAGRYPVDLPEGNRSTIVSVPVGADAARELVERLRVRGVVAAARDGYLRFSIHVYNHEDDIARVVAALTEP
jgi:selenocysteine lyase/cysteine desulfurase